MYLGLLGGTVRYLRREHIQRYRQQAEEELRAQNQTAEAQQAET